MADASVVSGNHSNSLRGNTKATGKNNNNISTCGGLGNEDLIISGDLLASLYKAVRLQKWRLVRLLLENGFDLSTTPLPPTASPTSTAEWTKRALATSGKSALFLALRLPYLDAFPEERQRLVTFLLDEDKLDVNQRDADAKTPLLVACERSLGASLVTSLLSRGADTGVVDRSGKSAVYYASAQGRTDIVQLIEQQQQEMNGVAIATAEEGEEAGEDGDRVPLLSSERDDVIRRPPPPSQRRFKRSVTCNTLPPPSSLTSSRSQLLSNDSKGSSSSSSKAVGNTLQRIASVDDNDADAGEERSIASLLTRQESSVARLLREGFLRHQNVTRLAASKELSNSSDKLATMRAAGPDAETDEAKRAKTRQFNLDIIKQALAEMERAASLAPAASSSLAPSLLTASVTGVKQPVLGALPSPILLRHTHTSKHRGTLSKSISQSLSPQPPRRYHDGSDDLAVSASMTMTTHSLRTSSDSLVIDIGEKQQQQLTPGSFRRRHYNLDLSPTGNGGIFALHGLGSGQGQGQDKVPLLRHGSTARLNDGLALSRPGILPALNVGTRPVIPSILSPRSAENEGGGESGSKVSPPTASNIAQDAASTSSSFPFPSPVLATDDTLAKRRHMFAAKRSLSMAERIFPSFATNGSGLLVDSTKVDVLRESFQKGLNG